MSFPSLQSSSTLPAVQSRCNFLAHPSSPNKHWMVLQGLVVTVPQLALPPQKWLRTLAPALCTLQYHLCLVSTAVLLIRQAAASLTSLVLPPWVRTLHRLLPRHVLAVYIESKSVHCKCCLFRYKVSFLIILNRHHTRCMHCVDLLPLMSTAAMRLLHSILCCTLHDNSTPVCKCNLAC